MKKQKIQKLSLYHPVTYQIKVPGKLDEQWIGWVGKIKITVENDDLDLPITLLTGTFDQAALQGLLRGLYNLGLPLISVYCIESSMMKR